MTTNEAARLLKCSRDHVGFLWRHKKIKGVKRADRKLDLDPISVGKRLEEKGKPNPVLKEKQQEMVFLAMPPFRPVGTPQNQSGEVTGDSKKRKPDMMSKVQAISVLANMSRSRKLNLEQITALQMGVRSLCKRHFDHMRGLVRWRERKAKEAEAAAKGGVE